MPKKPVQQPLLSMLAALLEYPDNFLLQALPEIETAISNTTQVPAANRAQLLQLIGYLQQHGLYDLQEAYVDVFDRGRATSLYLFEHVHGESRDRGQAMVDLLAMYEESGLYLAPGELPDYLPVFLEFLAHEPAERAYDLLGEISAIAEAIATALANTGTPYYAAVAVLLPLAGEEPLDINFEQAPRLETDIDTEALDKAWEDEPVNFLDPKQATQSLEQPVLFYDKRPEP